MRRRLVIISGGLAVLVMLALAAMPWWLGAALHAGGGFFGVKFAEYRRIGYTRFALEDVELTHARVGVKAARLEADAPAAWLWHRWTGRPGPVTAGEWSVTVADGEPPAQPARAHGWVPLREELARVLAGLDKWLPEAAVGKGEVRWGKDGRMEIAGAEWKDGILTVEAVRYREVEATAVLKREPAGRWELALAAADGSWQAALESDADAVTGTGTVWGQPVTLTARFAATGWRPVQAGATAAEWSVPGERVKLGKFYEKIGGRAALDWRDGKLALDLTATGAPAAGKEAPPLRVELHGSGDAQGVRVERLEVQVPGVAARLSKPVRVNRDGAMETGAADFSLEADLAAQPWFRARGKVKGSATLHLQKAKTPVITGEFTADDVWLLDWAMQSLRVRGKLEWPRLTVTEAEATPGADETVKLAGEWDFATRTLTGGTVEARLKRETAARWIPETLKFSSLTVTGTAAGSWPEISHAGKVTAADVSAGPLKPLAVSAEWTGKGATLDRADVTATAGDSQVTARGKLSAGVVEIAAFSLKQGGAVRLELAGPARVSWKPEITVEALDLAGPTGALSVAGKLGRSGRVTITARAVESAWLRDLLALRGPEWTLAKLEAQGSWDDGPVEFAGTGEASLALGEGHRADVTAKLRGDRDGVRIEALDARSEGQDIAHATGRLPLTLWPGRSGQAVRFDPAGALSLDAATVPGGVFWAKLEALTGLAVTEPKLAATVRGSWEHPEGALRLQVAKLGADEKRWPRALPEVTDLDVNLAAERDGVTLKTFALRLAGQEIRATGRLPVEEWEAFLAHPLERLETRGEARLEIPDAQVAALARYLPDYLAPTGKLQIDLSLHPGGQLGGFLKLEGAASRPLGPLGILQGIAAEATFAGRKVELHEVTAKAGGRPVTLSGEIELPVKGAPKLTLALKGENLPFVRQAGLLLRGDLDLKITTADDGVTRVTGESRLRDSLFLMDVRSLIPTGGGGAGPEQRPPYFSVGVKPFDGWQLDVRVHGERFLKVRTPVLTGVATANFKLGGTLGDPRVTGEATLDDGQVLLPFATFAVQEATVRITEANPFSPQISLTGTSLRYGYDLRMEIRGPAERPQMTFTSSPALESEQVLLMVMAGQTPQNEISYSGGQRAARLGAYFGQSLLGSLGIDSSGGDNLSMAVGEKISEQGRETYLIEYSLGKRWSLVGEYDEFDAYNVGVKLKLFGEKPKEGTADAQP